MEMIFFHKKSIFHVRWLRIAVSELVIRDAEGELAVLLLYF